MLDQLLEEINELKQYKQLYEHQKADKERMSSFLYDLMLEKYNSTSYEERVKLYKDEMCRCCRYNYCGIELPQDIMEPIPSDNSWIPRKKACGDFEWD